MTRIAETISTKIGSIWYTGAAKRGGTIYIVDRDYNEEEAKEAVRAAKKTLREVGFAANVDYYWCHTGDKPLRMCIRTTKKQEESNAEREAIEALVEAWDLDVLHGEIDEVEMAESLTLQVEGGTQGWDMSAEDAEDHPDIALMIGLQIDPYTEVEDPTDEDMAKADRLWEAWGRVVGEAARRWLASHPEAAQAAREEA